jgi:hypothetical protein
LYPIGSRCRNTNPLFAEFTALQRHDSGFAPCAFSPRSGDKALVTWRNAIGNNVPIVGEFKKEQTG